MSLPPIGSVEREALEIGLSRAIARRPRLLTNPVGQLIWRLAMTREPPAPSPPAPEPSKPPSDLSAPLEEATQRASKLKAEKEQVARNALATISTLQSRVESLLAHKATAEARATAAEGKVASLEARARTAEGKTAEAVERATSAEKRAVSAEAKILFDREELAAQLAMAKSEVATATQKGRVIQRDKIVSALREVEWGAKRDTRYARGTPTCPACGGVRPNLSVNGRPVSGPEIDHRQGCWLYRLIHVAMDLA